MKFTFRVGQKRSSTSLQNCFKPPLLIGGRRCNGAFLGNLPKASSTCNNTWDYFDNPYHQRITSGRAVKHVGITGVNVASFLCFRRGFISTGKAKRE